jgi:hypothetical protein
MGAPMGNKNASGSHQKGWYKSSNTHHNLRKLRSPEATWTFHEKRMAHRANRAPKGQSNIIKKFFGGN